MIDQIGLARTFDDGHGPLSRPLGRGLNLQIRVDSVDALLPALARHGVDVLVPVEDRWYRSAATELGQRQFVVADPDGYLLRFFEDLGER
jgi:catechol 2,3-dioxygenase-like lactoylglutathione lyase family enzyme